jgi:hypothetical protein
LILSNQTLKADVDEFKNVTVEYDLKAPFKELAKIKKASGVNTGFFEWCPEAGSNHRHKDFQSFALPTELSGHITLKENF